MPHVEVGECLLGSEIAVVLRFATLDRGVIDRLAPGVVGNSSYHAFQFSVNKRFSKGYTILAHYNELDAECYSNVTRVLKLPFAGVETHDLFIRETYAKDRYGEDVLRPCDGRAVNTSSSP